MKHIYQPTNVTCGQTCVAMVAGVSVDKAIEVFGKKGKTRTADLIRALRKLGYRSASKLERKYAGTSFPELCIAHVKVNKEFEKYQLNKRWGHWVVVRHGKIYDPAEGIDPVYPKGIVAVSFLKVHGRRP